MLMPDNSLENFTFDEDISPDEDDSDRLCVDLDFLWGLIDEKTPESDQNKPEDSTVTNLPQGFLKLEEQTSLGINGTGLDACSYSFNSEVSDSRAGSSEGSSNSAGKPVIFETVKQEYSAQNGTPACSLTRSLSDWNSQKPSCSSQDISFETKGVTHNCSTEKSNFASGSYGDLVDSSSQSLGAPYMEASTIADTSLSNYELMDFDIPHIGSPGAFYDQDSIGSDSTSYFAPSGQYSAEDSLYQHIENNSHLVANVKDEYGMLPTHSACLGDAVKFDSSVEVAGRAFSAASETANSYTRGTNENIEGLDYILPNYGVSYDNLDFGQTFGRISSAENLPHVMSNTCSKEPAVCVKDEKSKVRSYMTAVDVGGRKFHRVDDQLSSKKQAFHIKDEQNDQGCATQGTAYRSFINVDDMADWKSSDTADGFYVDKGTRQSVNGSLTSTLCKRQVIANTVPSRDHYSFVKSETCTVLNPVAQSHSLDIQELDQPSFKQTQHIKEERVSELTESSSRGSHFSKRSHQTVHNSALAQRSHIDDDSDICILENLSKPARLNHSPMSVNMNISSRSSSIIESRTRFDVGGMRVKTKDERDIFRAALQDISQPKSEATPPDGLLAVPLLKHQRIALSWMVQKETSSTHCSGGILADDQGLGKTISTIALILKERAPSSKSCPTSTKNLETLNLDDDDDDSVTEFSNTNLGTGSSQNSVGGSSTAVRNLSMQPKVKPAAGTLIVCPTSVLRQWSEELHNKVTKEADLSVLTYHGGNRTKDPSELAKYDIILTTYAIVSMEVPKQPLVDKDDEETVRHSHLQPMEHPSTKKRKYPPSSGERSLKSKKANNELIEAAARPLAQVRWFRVVLDEAQSIKNYKTQVARACWGLKAKRRWCLSGTPIQNSIDDLYSYFRFLKYDPYAAYKTFCSQIKAPIQKNPATGYRKLQAVLKTIMLRRTKGTFLDGEPIINLPPKTIELKKVDFTMEERDFYCTLEAESRAQFAKYAEAGTVKQNYVNILLMLLRLRQACDHPLLVRGCTSDSAWTSSVEMAKKLPPEKQASLLNCLEASLAICGMCSDPPEDAVVTSCGHVFCNQCISEHLTSDDNQCPTSNCKVRLTVSSVYSKETLKTSLSEGVESVTDCSGSVPAKTLQPCSSGGAFDSSKIKAAIKVLRSLSKPRSLVQKTSSSVSIGGGLQCSEDLSNSLLGAHNNLHDKQSMDLENDSNSLVPEVGEKAIVFSQWTRMLDLLEAGLKGSSINYRRLDGTMSVMARDKAVKDFNTQPEVSVIIMSLKAASLGLNMVAACHVLLLDLWWNPTTEDQAIDRAHRIGQTRPVSVLRLTVKDTVEDRILALQQKKREMVASAFGEDETGSRQTRLTVEDLQYLFMYN